MSSRNYSHSVYFAAKKAAEGRKARRIDLARFAPGALPSVERRVRLLGKAPLDHTMHFFGDHFDRLTAGRGWFSRDENIGLSIAVLGFTLAADIGTAIVRDVKTVADPAARQVMKRELMKSLRKLRRPWYYARETERRRRLAHERRKVRCRSTTAACPTPEALLAAWKARKDSREAMIRLGGMLHDLACYVDSALRFDEDGKVVGRNGGIRGWLKENLEELAPKYKTLMRYKAMAIKLRQATGTTDPTPTEALLANVSGTSAAAEGAAGLKTGVFPGRKAIFRRKSGVKETNENFMRKILEGDGRQTFAGLMRAIEMKVGVKLVGYE